MLISGAEENGERERLPTMAAAALVLLVATRQLRRWQQQQPLTKKETGLNRWSGWDEVREGGGGGGGGGANNGEQQKAVDTCCRRGPLPVNSLWQVRPGDGGSCQRKTPSFPSLRFLSSSSSPHHQFCSKHSSHYNQKRRQRPPATLGNCKKEMKN